MVSQLNQPISVEDYITLAKARAAFSSFLGMLFLNIPDGTLIDYIHSAGFVASLEKLQQDDNVHSDISTGAGWILKFLQATRDLDTDVLLDQIAVDRTRLYRGVTPTYGPPPPYEAVWGPEAIRPHQLLQKLSEIYRQAGMVPSSANNERPDYLGVELAFLENLANAEASSWESGNREAAYALLESQKDFLHDHLAMWVPAFIEKALEFSQTDFYRGQLIMMRGFILDQQEVLSSLPTH